MVRWLSGIMFVGVGVFVAVSTYLQPILHHDHISSTAAGLMLAGMLLAGVAGCAINPPIVARRGAQRGYLTLAVVCVAIAMALMAIAHAVTAFDFVAIAAVGFLLLADGQSRRADRGGRGRPGERDPGGRVPVAVGRDAVRAADCATRPLRDPDAGRGAGLAGSADARGLSSPSLRRRRRPPNRCKVRRIDLHLCRVKAHQRDGKLTFTGHPSSVVTTESEERRSSFPRGCRHGLVERPEWRS
jgi:hypothetical protein